MTEGRKKLWGGFKLHVKIHWNRRACKRDTWLVTIECESRQIVQLTEVRAALAINSTNPTEVMDFAIQATLEINQQ